MAKIYLQGYFRFSDERAEKKFTEMFGEPVLAPHEVQGLLDRVYCSIWVDEEVCNYFQKIPGTPEKVGVIKSN